VNERNIVTMDECFWINAPQWCAWHKNKQATTKKSPRFCVHKAKCLLTIETELFSFLFYPRWMRLMFTCVLRHYVSCTALLVPNLWAGVDRVSGQLRRRDKECPFSGVTKSARVWRKVPESAAGSVGTNMNGSSLAPEHPRKHETSPTRVKIKCKKFCLDSDGLGFICAGVSNIVSHKINVWYHFNCLLRSYCRLGIIEKLR